MNQQMHSDMTYSLGFRTDVGRQRSNNEDAVAAFELPGADAAFVLCDGMGGLRAGDIAAKEAVHAVQSCLVEQFQRGVQDPIKALGEAFRRANDAVNALSPVEEPTTVANHGGDFVSPTVQQESAREPRKLMGTTCVAGLVQEGVLYLGHAGDSRAYRWRRGHLTRLTEDHSFVAERVRAGDMTEAEAKVSRFRNIVTRAIGIDTSVEPEFRREPIEPGDLILVCSDGLTTMMDDPEIAQLLNRPAVRRNTPEQNAAMLVDAANRAGGSDNITVLLLKAPGDAPAQESAGIIDIDTMNTRSKTSGVVLLYVLLGILLTLVILMALFTFVPPFRNRIVQLANPPAGTTPQTQSSPATTMLSGNNNSVDFRSLRYDAPASFSDLLARGDLLSYSPGKGVYFVAGSSGKVALLDKTGKALYSVESLDMVNLSDTAEISPTHVFMTSDPQGNVYISYTSKKIIEKKGADGKLLDVIRGFERPEAIAVDDEGNLLVVDFNQIKICRAHLPKPSPSPTGSASPAVKNAKPAKGQG